jgi:hypothetical protein
MHNHARAYRVLTRIPEPAQREPAARVPRESELLLEFTEAF